jgi:C-terminal processing protease CtpA/Prc
MALRDVGRQGSQTISLVEDDRLEVHLPDGTLLPERQDIDLDGTALPFQRPLVILIGPGSISGAESFAAPMLAYRRATLGAERTAGACGLVRSVHLAPGRSIFLATHHTDFALSGKGI